MNRLLHLAALSMLVLTILAPTAGAQGNDINCPEGSAANAAGTRCTDSATGEFVEPISITTPNPETPETNPCPELQSLQAGRCVPIDLPSSSEPTQPQRDPETYFGNSNDDLVEAPEPKLEQTQPQQKAQPKSLPNTGGSAFLLPAGALLVGSGLLALGILRRS